MKILLIILGIWNMIVFLMYGYDKRCAIKKRFRISEKTLILSALLGGGIGAYVGMELFRHKTKHLSFKISVPIGVFITIGIIVAIVYFIR